MKPPFTGECYCGCGLETKTHFVAYKGHDGKAISMLKDIHGDGYYAGLVAHFGYGPQGKNLREAHAEWKGRPPTTGGKP